MANFRSGFLQRGTPLGGTQKEVGVYQPGVVIDTTGSSFIKLYSDIGKNNIAAVAAAAVITVVSVKHGLITGNLIDVYNGAGFPTTPTNVNGLDIAVTFIDVDSFSFVAPGGAPGDGAGTLDYYRSASTRTITLLDGTLANQQVTLVVETNSIILLEQTGNIISSGDWQGFQYDSIILTWDQNNTNWMESGRNNLSTDSDQFIIAPANADILIYDSVDARFENRQVSGDIQLASDGTTSISAGSIVDADISASAAILVTKLEALVPNVAAIINGSGILDISVTTDTELSYVSGTTSLIQPQLDGKISTTLSTGDMLVGVANVATALVPGAEASVLTVTAGLPNWATATVPDSSITITKCSRNVVAEATGTITSAQILNLFNTPIEIVASPGAGLYTVVEEVELFHDYDTAVYAVGGILQVEYGSGVDIMSFPVTLMTGGADQSYFGTPGVYDLNQVAGTGGLDITTSIGQNVRLTNLTALFINGNVNNVLKYRIRYHTATALS